MNTPHPPPFGPGQRPQYRHIDLYAAHNLDPRASCAELATELSVQFANTDPENQLARRRIETARSILGAEDVRTAYDARLTDHYAEPITEEVLASMAAVSQTTVVPGVAKVVVTTSRGTKEFKAGSWSLSQADDGATLVITGTDSEPEGKSSDSAGWIGAVIGGLLS